MSTANNVKKSPKTPERKNTSQSSATKSPAKGKYSSVTILRKRVVRLLDISSLSNGLIYAMGFCILVTIILVICGAVNVRATYPLYIAAVMTFLTAVILLILYVRVNNCFTSDPQCTRKHASQKMDIATLDNLAYYSQLPPGGKTDYPMGPHLIMTLPKSSRWRIHTPSPDSIRNEARSAPTTPARSGKKMPVRARNIPPLASEETLSPSLAGSSYISIDSVV